MKKLFLLLLLFTNLIFSQLSINSTSTNYTQDFNTLTSGVWSNNVTLPGWYARTDATASITAYGANTGSTITAGLYAFGVVGTNPLSDRALGFVTSNAYTGAAGTGKNYLGWRLKNNTGSEITSITVTWTGEQWRKENNSLSQSINLSYQTSSSVTDLTTGTWTNATSTFTTPITGATAATAIDGNVPAHRSQGISVVINVIIPVGNEIMLRWEDLNDAGNDHSIGIDDIVVNVSGGCSTSITTQPTNQTIAENNSTTFSVTATNVSSYQWQVSTDGTNYTNITNSGIYSGANTSILSISNTSLAMSGYRYRCQLTPNPTCTITLINQNFNTNDFSFVNNATPTNNNWRYGTTTGNPSSAIYISNDNGITNNYTLTSTPNVTFAYRDVVIPSGTTTSTFLFDWRCNGERTVGTDYDYLRVWLAPTSFTPVEGTQIVAGSGRIQVGSNFNQQNTWTTFSNTSLNVSSFAGSSMRIIYEWINDSSGGSQFPAAIDNVILNIPSTTVSSTIVNTNVATLTVTGCLLEGFSGGATAPVSWTFNNISTYTFDFGLASPSLRMDATGDIIETPIVSNIQQLSFWIKGQGTDTNSALVIEGFNGTSWITVDNITNSIPTTGTTKIYNSTTNPVLPQNMQKFRFTYTKSVGNLALDDVSFNCSSCFSTTTWNGTIWSNGSPNNSTNAVIDSDYNTNTNSFEACSVIVNPGKILTINSNQYVSIQNALINNGIVNINDGSLVQFNNATNIGDINYNRNVSSLNGYDYIYWSSPVNNQTINNLYSSPNMGFKYEWNPLFNNTNGTQGNWIIPSTTMTNGKGYIIRASSSYGWTGNLTAKFTGVPNNGDITIPIQKGTLSGIDDNWNLIGNPYPSTLSAESFLTKNTNIAGSVYIWTHVSNPLISNATSPFYSSFQYNYSNDYIVYNKLGSSVSSTFTGNIAPGQGFFINMSESTSTPSSVLFDNTLRNTNNSQFYRVQNQKSRIWLDLLNINNNVNRILVGYVDDATNDNDRMYDSETVISTTNNTIYSVIDNKPFIIQGKDEFEDTDQVQLGININTPGEYKIAIAETDGILTTQNIYLQDLYSNVIYDIRQSPYIFNSNVGTFNDRFILRYTNSTLGNNDFIINNTIIYNKDNKINIDSNKIIKNVKVYDITGKILYDNNFNSNNVKISLECSKQILFVKIKTEDDQVITKKVFNE